MFLVYMMPTTGLRGGRRDAIRLFVQCHFNVSLPVRDVDLYDNVVICSDDNEIMGVGLVRTFNTPAPGVWQLGAVVVRNTHRDRGFGSQMLQVLRDHAQNAKASIVIPQSLPTSPYPTRLLAWFARHGIEPEDPPPATDAGSTCSSPEAAWP